MKNTIYKQGYKTLSVSPKEEKSITISPKIKNGKNCVRQNNRKHRFLYEE